MNNKYFKLVVLAATMMLAACSEFGPVFTCEYDKPDKQYGFNINPTHTIAQLKAMYVGSPLKITDDIVICGQITTSDEAGNFYRSFFIQDATGGIEVKVGKTTMYNDYKPGQWVAIKCRDLCLGSYGGMVQLGAPDQSGSYETAYMDASWYIDLHVIRGSHSSLPAAKVIDAAGLKDKSNYGRLVTVNGLKYGNEIFVIIYDRNGNSTYLSGANKYGLDTWAMTANGFAKYMENGFNNAVSEENRSKFDNSAYTVSQYFDKDGVDLQVRTSGYSSFADTKIDERILGGAKVSMTGILAIYNNNIQFTLIDMDGVAIE